MRTVVYKASQVVQKHFMMVKKLQGAGLLHVMQNNLLGAFSLQKKEHFTRIFPAKDRGSKKRENGNKYNGKRNSNKQSFHTRKNTLESNTDVALTVYTCLANITGTLQTGRDRKIRAQFHNIAQDNQSLYSLTSLSFNCLLKAGGEISYKEGSMESQIFGPRCFRDLLPLTVEASCQMYPPRVATRVAWEYNLMMLVYMSESKIFSQIFAKLLPKAKRAPLWRLSLGWGVSQKTVFNRY